MPSPNAAGFEMAAQEKAPAVAAARGEAAFDRYRQRGNFAPTYRQRKPPYARQFRLGPRQTAVICLGWPPVQPPARNVLVLPNDEPAGRFDWSLLRGEFALCTPPPDEIAGHETLRLLAVELAAAGVAGLALFDGQRIVGEWWKEAPQSRGAA